MHEIFALLRCYTGFVGFFCRRLVTDVLGQHTVTLKMAPICCPRTLVTNCQLTLHNTPEGLRSHLHCGRSLELPIVCEIAYMLSGSMSLKKIWHFVLNVCHPKPSWENQVVDYFYGRCYDKFLYRPGLEGSVRFITDIKSMHYLCMYNHMPEIMISLPFEDFMVIIQLCGRNSCMLVSNCTSQLWSLWLGGQLNRISLCTDTAFNLNLYKWREMKKLHQIFYFTHTCQIFF